MSSEIDQWIGIEEDKEWEQERVMSDYTGPMETGAEESLRNQLVYCKDHRTLTSIRPDGLPKWCCEVAALEQRVEGLVEDLEGAYMDRTQLFEAVQYAVDFMPEYHANIRVRAKLEMALTDLVASQEEA